MIALRIESPNVEKRAYGQDCGFFNRMDSI
jgi:hypothetical protein